MDSSLESQVELTDMSVGRVKIGQRIPDFQTSCLLQSGEISETFSLNKYLGEYLVLFFYPRDFTFVCPTEIIAFSDRLQEFSSINCNVIACSTDSSFSHLAWTNQDRKSGGLGKMDIPIMADKNFKISKLFGVLEENEGAAYRGLFIMDKELKLRQITINDMPVGRSVDETLRLVQAFQFTDEHGEVCPANWTPGKTAIKPDSKGKKSFFEKIYRKSSKVKL